MKVLGSGPDGMLLEGHEYDIDDGMGRELVDGGYAELIPEPPAAEEDELEEPAEDSEPPAGGESAENEPAAEEDESEEPAAASEPAAGEEPAEEEPAAEEKPKPKRARKSRKAAAKESEE